MGYQINPFTGQLDLSGTSTGGYVGYKAPVATEATLPTVGNVAGDMRVTLDSDLAWIYDGTTSRWINTGLKVSNAGSTPGPYGYTIEDVNVGLNRAERRLVLQPADSTNPGIVSTTTQSFAGNKTFDDDVTVTGVTYADGGVDTTGAATLSIGSVNATIINVGNASATVNFNGTVNNNNVTNLNVADQLITINSGGGAGSASGTGLEIEEASVITGYIKTSGDRNDLLIKTPNKAGVITVPGQTTNDTVALLDTSQTLTNKTIDADQNTISNIEDADIKALAAIDATKIADGSVTNTEFQYINTVTSNVQDQLDGKEPVVVGTPLEIYIDTTNGDDTTGLGTVTRPYKTVHKAVTVATNLSLQYVFMLAPGDYTGAPLLLPGNISIVGNLASIQFDITLDVQPASQISPVYSGVSFSNFTMDLTPANVALPVFLNAGFNITRLDATTGAHAVQIHDGQITSLDLTGNALLNNMLFVGTTTVQTGGGLLLTGCTVGIGMDVYGTGTVSMTGCVFSGSITGHTIGPDTPVIRTDSSSLGYGGTITGATLQYSDVAATVGYTETVPTDWSGPPVTTGAALDELASRVPVAGAVASVTASAPLSSSGGLNPDISISLADTTTDGYLSSTDWNTFNNKQPAGNYITDLTGGDVTATGPGSVAATIAANAVTDSKFRQSAGLSVVGRAGNTTGDVADITAATDNEVLRRSGTSVGFGLLVDANIDATAAIDRAKIATGTADHVVINDGTGALSSEAQLAVSRGGTGTDFGATLAAEDIILGSSATALKNLAVGSNGDILTVTAGTVGWAPPVVQVPGVFGSRGTPRSIVAANGIASAGSDMSTTDINQVVFIEGSGGAVDITATPQIEAHTIVGAKMTIIGRSDTNTVKLDNGTGLELNGSATLGASDILELVWDGTSWIEMSRNI